MNVKEKSKDQLIKELTELRHQVFEMQKSATKKSSGLPVADKSKEQLIDELSSYCAKLEELLDEQKMKLQTTLAQLDQETARRKLAEQELEEQLFFCQRLMDIIPIPVFYKDTNGLYQGCNTAFEAYIGFSKEEIIGKTVYDIAPQYLADKYFEMDQFLFRDQGVQTYEASVRYFDGTVHDNIFKKATFSYNNQTAGIVGVINDITEYKKFNEVLRESEERYRRLVELSPDFISVQSEGQVVFINWAGAKLLGVESPKELIGKSFMDFIHQDFKKIFYERVQLMQTEGNTVPVFEGKFCSLNGTNIDVEVSAVALTLQGKSVVQIIARDITQRKQVEQALQSERQRLFSLFDSFPALIYLQAPDHTIHFSNRYFWERFGKPGKKSCYEIFHGRKQPCQDCPVPLVFDKKKPAAFENTESDGRHYQFSIHHFSDIDGSPLVLIMGIDTTEQAETAKKLQAAHEQLIDIIEFLPDATFVIDSDKKVIAWNRALEEMVGLPKGQVIGKGDNAYAIPFHGQRVPILIDYVFENKINIKDDKYYFIENKGNRFFAEGFVPSMFDGKGAYVWAVASPLFDRSGNIVGAIESIRDISERKQAEASLRLSEGRFSKVFNNSPLPMSIHSLPDGRFLYLNASMEKFIGYQRKECVGRTGRELNLWVDPDDEDKMGGLLDKQVIIRNMEIYSRMKSGELRVGLFSADYINFDNQQCLLNVITDITERKQFEKEMFRLDRLNLIGEMAAGIGHEVRNPMTTVRGFLQILGSKKECLLYKEHFELMIGELDRANSIITEFLSLAKSKATEYKLININSIVEALLPLIRADAMKDDKYLNLELGETPDLSLNEKEIRQLILNLVRNGLEAMSSEGNLTIRTFMENEAVILSVQDQGNGIESEVLEKLGTPFFTTKEYGTGLGLAVCYSIAARHQAKIEIESNSTGTTFFVRFSQTNQPQVKTENNLRHEK